jgi:hypothetical protein
VLCAPPDRISGAHLFFLLLTNCPSSRSLLTAMASALRRCVLAAPRSILRPLSSRIASQPALYRIAAFTPRTPVPRAFATSVLRSSAPAYAESGTLPASAPYTTFESLNDVVSRPILDNIINRMGLRDMTEVQSQTITAALQGVDM